MHVIFFYKQFTAVSVLSAGISMNSFLCHFYTWPVYQCIIFTSLDLMLDEYNISFKQLSLLQKGNSKYCLWHQRRILENLHYYTIKSRFMTFYGKRNFLKKLISSL